MLRVTLKKGIRVKQLSLDSLVLNRELDTIVKEGYTALQIYAPPYGGKSFNGLDVIDHYKIDPNVGTMEDFKRLVRQVHRKGLAIVSVDNIGYCSVDAPSFLKACQDVARGIVSKETKWFSWADSSTAKPPMIPDDYYLGGSKYEKWAYSPIAQKYYWSKWDGVDKNGKACALPQFKWSPEWQAEIKNIIHFWMNTGIDGMLLDAVSWYTNYDWKIGHQSVTDIIGSYGNTFMLPEGAGGFHEDPVPWITEGGWNCVIDYGLGIWWEMKTNALFNSIRDHDPSELENVLRDFHDRVVAAGGILNIDDVGADNEFKNPAQYRLYVAFLIATGHLYCRSMHSTDSYRVVPAMAQLLHIKKSHPALEQLGIRRKLNTDNDHKFYAFIEESADHSDRLLCVFNFQETPQVVKVDMSGVNTPYLIDLKSGEKISYDKQMQFSVPAYGYQFYKITDEVF
jgi:glycosidase